jgi:hypothetical protein
MKECLFCGREIVADWEYEVCPICAHSSDHGLIVILAERVSKLDQPEGEVERLRKWLLFIGGFDLHEYVGGHIGAAKAALDGKPAPKW